MRFIVMFVTAVCVLFLIKLRWPKKKSIYIYRCFGKGCPTKPYATMPKVIMGNGVYGPKLRLFSVLAT